MSFLHFYHNFSHSVETYNLSNRQLNYLLLKDLFIPFLSHITLEIFQNYYSYIIEMKDINSKSPLNSFFKWVEKKALTDDVFDYLERKHNEDISYENDEFNVYKDESSARNSIRNWKNGKDIKLISINRVSKYIEDVYENKIEKKLVKKLFIFSKCYQKIYTFLTNSYNKEEFLLLIEHYYLILEFAKFYDPNESIELNYSFIEKKYFQNVKFEDNCGYYYYDYFLLMNTILYSDESFKSIKKKFFKRNGLLYEVNENLAFKYMPIYLPINLFLNKQNIEEFNSLYNDFIQTFENIDKKHDIKNWKNKWSLFPTEIEKINYLKSCLYFYFLNPTISKTINILYEANEILSLLEDNFNLTEKSLHISFFKSRYYLYKGKKQELKLNKKEAILNYKEGLYYCKKALESDKYKTGEHIKEIINDGVLLSAKLKSKSNYNKFLNEAKISNILFYGKLRVSSREGYRICTVPENIGDFSSLVKVFNEYFKV